MLHPDAQARHCIRCHIKEIVAQLRLCGYGYECEGGPLENNVSFRELCEIADSHPDYWVDMEGDAVYVECDCAFNPVVASFQFDVPDGDESGCAANAWVQAEAHIAKLRAEEIKPTQYLPQKTKGN